MSDPLLEAAESLLPGDGIEGLYLHVPFCRKRCSYCAFHSQALPQDDQLLDDYALALSNRVRRLSKAGLLGDLRTIYLGGGTPSFLGARRLSGLIYMISLRVNLHDDTEFTLELNPDSFDRALLKDLWALGVNRYSVGVQSFDDAVLKRLGRIHDANKALDAIDMLRERDANFSVDLICGIPGQSMASWEESLQRVIDLGVPHVSVYPLSMEEGTPFAHAVESGTMPLPDDDLAADMMLLAHDMLQDAGLHHYEVASYARPGFESRHNLSYWKGAQYLGLGSSAASMLRKANLEALLDSGILAVEGDGAALDGIGAHDSLRLVCQQDATSFARSLGDVPMLVDLEHLDLRSSVIEQIMLRMRLFEALDPAWLPVLDAAVPKLLETLETLRREGLLDERFVPTGRGWLLGNRIYGSIWDLA